MLEDAVGAKNFRCGRGARSAGPFSGGEDGARPSRRSRLAAGLSSTFRESIETILSFTPIMRVAYFGRMRKSV